MTNIEHANRWNKIIKCFYEIELNPKNSLIKRFYAHKYEGFAVAMLRMYREKTVHAKEVQNMNDKLQYVDKRALDLMTDLIAIGYHVHHVDLRHGCLPRDEKHLVVRIHKPGEFNGMVIESPLSWASNYHARIYLVRKP